MAILDFHVHLTAWGKVPQAERQAYVDSFPACLAHGRLWRRKAAGVKA